jgi:hypothetical protein
MPSCPGQINPRPSCPDHGDPTGPVADPASASRTVATRRQARDRGAWRSPRPHHRAHPGEEALECLAPSLLPRCGVGTHATIVARRLAGLPYGSPTRPALRHAPSSAPVPLEIEKPPELARTGERQNPSSGRVSASCRRSAEGADRTRPTGRLTFSYAPDLPFCWLPGPQFRSSSARFSVRAASMALRPRSSASGTGGVDVAGEAGLAVAEGLADDFHVDAGVQTGREHCPNLANRPGGC